MLSIDLGTTAIKCAVYSRSGELVAERSREYSLSTPTPDRVEVDASVYWDTFRECLFELQEAASRAGPIAGIGISAQGETLVLIDSNGEALRPAIVWLDNRASIEAQELNDHFTVSHVYEKTGQPGVGAALPAAKLKWLSRHEPSVMARTWKVLLLEDFFIFRLTGELLCEGSLITTTAYWDFRRKTWWPEMLDAIGISSEMLPAIAEPGTLAGTITQKAATELRLDPETVVCLGALDQACGAIGVGSTRPGVFSENTGAAVALCATVASPVFDPSMRMPCHYHGIPDTWMLHTFTSGGIVLKWFRDVFATSEMQLAPRLGIDAFELIGVQAARVAPGAQGLMMLPHLQGAMSPDANDHARACWIGLSLQHGLPHMARALLESVALVVRRNIEVVEELGQPVASIRASGGGARSAVWKQIEADVTGRPVQTMLHSDAGTLGAAMLTSKALGWFATIQEAEEHFVRVNHTYLPTASNEAVYSELYGAYREATGALVGVFDRLRRVAS